MDKDLARRNDLADEMTPAEILVREGKQLVRTQAPFQTAIVVQKPREIPKIRARLTEEAELAGEAFYYSWKIKTKKGPATVEGPSIQLAQSAARLFGNCVWSVDLVGEDEDCYYLNGHFVDLETGLNLIRPFRQKKEIYGKYDEDRKEDISFQMGVSKCLRNVITKGGVAMWLIDQAMNVAKQSNVKRFEEIWKNPNAKKEKIEGAIAEFAKHQVTESMIEDLMGPKKSWGPNTMAELAGMIQALRDGQSTVAEIFGIQGEMEADFEAFWKKCEDAGFAREQVEEYLGQYCKTMGIHQGEMINDSLGDWESFGGSFMAWRENTGYGKKPSGKQRRKQKSRGDTKAEEKKSQSGANTEAGAGEQGQKPKAVDPKYLFSRIKQKVIEVESLEDAKKFFKADLTPEQANKILGFINSAEGGIEQDEFEKKVKEICG